MVQSHLQKWSRPVGGPDRKWLSRQRDDERWRAASPATQQAYLAAARAQVGCVRPKDAARKALREAEQTRTHDGAARPLAVSPPAASPDARGRPPTCFAALMRLITPLATPPVQEPPLSWPPRTDYAELVAGAASCKAWLEVALEACAAEGATAGDRPQAAELSVCPIMAWCVAAHFATQNRRDEFTHRAIELAKVTVRFVLPRTAWARGSTAAQCGEWTSAFGEGGKQLTQVGTAAGLVVVLIRESTTKPAPVPTTPTPANPASADPVGRPGGWRLVLDSMEARADALAPAELARAHCLMDALAELQGTHTPPESQGRASAVLEGVQEAAQSYVAWGLKSRCKGAQSADKIALAFGWCGAGAVARGSGGVEPYAPSADTYARIEAEREAHTKGAASPLPQGAFETQVKETHAEVRWLEERLLALSEEMSLAYALAANPNKGPPNHGPYACVALRCYSSLVFNSDAEEFQRHEHVDADTDNLTPNLFLPAEALWHTLALGFPREAVELAEGEGRRSVGQYVRLYAHLAALDGALLRSAANHGRFVRSASNRVLEKTARVIYFNPRLPHGTPPLATWAVPGAAPVGAHGLLLHSGQAMHNAGLKRLLREDRAAHRSAAVARLAAHRSPASHRSPARHAPPPLRLGLRSRCAPAEGRLASADDGRARPSLRGRPSQNLRSSTSAARG